MAQLGEKGKGKGIMDTCYSSTQIRNQQAAALYNLGSGS